MTELREATPVSDPVTLQIVANALQSIADEMATTIIRTAHSTVVRDGMDFSSALCDAHGETVAQAVSVPFHLGSIPTAMASLIGHYGDGVRPGDVFIMNDPFDGGMHLQDIFVVKPVYLGDSIIGWAVTTAHHADVGGRLPGSSACDNSEIFQEGLRMPWLRFYAEGEPVEEVHKLIEANMRIPRMTFGDLGAQVAACSVAERALVALATRYGREELARLEVALIDYTERLVRQEILAWPDGTATFTDYLGSDGIDACDVPIRATVTIDGDEVIADLTESAPMVRGSLNSTRSFVMACVYHVVRCALTLEVPNTAGAFRPVRVLTKPGTVAEVVMPGASSMRGVTGFRVVDALNGALAQLIPDRVPAAGEGGNTLAIFGADRAGDEDRYVFYELIVGTWGGTPTWDGNDGLTNPASLAANIPVEVAESEFPIVVERYGLVPDTGGAGRHRGGLAIERVWRCLTPGTSLIVRSDRADRPPYGLAGGGTGATSSNVLLRPDGTEEPLPAMFSITIEAGDVYVHRTAGGGGWGDPCERDPDAVAVDVANEKVSVAAARERYGVVIRPDGTADAAATAAAARREETCVIEKADAVVIGAGIMGASTAHFLTKLGFGQVALVEKRKICGGSTQYSAAHVRQHYSNEVGIRLAVRGAEMFANAEEELGGPAGFEQIGYMLFAPPGGRAGAARDRPDPAELRRRHNADRARRGRAPLARAPTRGGRARLLRADFRLRESRPHGRVARPIGRAGRARCLRGLRGARHHDRQRPRHRRRHRRRRDRDRRRRQRLRPVGRPGRPPGRRRLPDHVQPRARGGLRRAGRLRRSSRSSPTSRSGSTAARFRAARCSSARAGRRRRSPWTPRRTTTAPTRRTCRQWCRSS